MATFDSNTFYPPEKGGDIDKLKSKLESLDDSKRKLQERMHEIDAEIRDLNAKIFEREDGRLLRALKNLLATNTIPELSDEVKKELIKIDIGSVMKRGRPPKADKATKRAAAIGSGDDLPPNPDAIAMPATKRAK